MKSLVPAFARRTHRDSVRELFRAVQLQLAKRIAQRYVLVAVQGLQSFTVTVFLSSHLFFSVPCLQWSSAVYTTPPSKLSVISSYLLTVDTKDSVCTAKPISW